MSLLPPLFSRAAITGQPAPHRVLISQFSGQRLACSALFSFLSMVVLAAFLAGCQSQVPGPVPGLQMTQGPALGGESESQPIITNTAQARVFIPSASGSQGVSPIVPEQGSGDGTMTPKATPTGPILQRTENILVMGVDHRRNDPNPAWRTDSMIVVAIDKEQSRVGIVNIPRDLFVSIPTLGQGRINQADYWGEKSEYPGGGPALVGRVLSETMEIPIHHYVRIQMDGLVRLVDALGGVTVTLDCPLYEVAPDNNAPGGLLYFYLPAGDTLLDGVSAKKFATWRYITSDFGRTQRQQQLIWAIRDRMLQLDIVPRIPALWNALSDAFATDLNMLDVIRLARFGLTLQPGAVYGKVLSRQVFRDTVTYGGAQVLVISNKRALQAELSALFESTTLAAIGASDPGKCPPLPRWLPTPTPTASTAPETTGTPVVSDAVN